MIFTFLHRHLPGWLATFTCGLVYAALIGAVWIKWDTTEAVFRYAGF